MSAHAESPLLELGAFELAGKIRSGQCTSLEVVDAHINEVKKWNPLINAVVEDNFNSAYSQARACDAEVQKRRTAGADAVNTLPPLFGVPFTLKEMISVANFKHTLGSVHRRSFISKHDATVTTRLKKAGAILMGTTNVPELGFWFECANEIYGRTNNPYDLSRTSGGSTGGEAALVGAGASPFGLGSDIGGSVRMPAGFCGVFGHKPSGRLVPMTGHFPIYHTEAEKWRGDRYPLTVLGPLTRKASDLYPLMELLIGPDQIDLEIRPGFKLKPRVTDWTGKVVWVMPSPSIKGVARTTPEIAETAMTAARYFEAMGATLKVMRANVFEDAVKLWFASLSKASGRSFTEILSDGQTIDYKRELLKLVLFKGDYTLPALGASLLETLSRRFESKLEGTKQESFDQIGQLKKELGALLGEDAILILPVHPRTAPKHNTPILRPFDFAMTGIFNALEVPATAVPMGLGEQGLPLAVQVIAADGQDHLTISAAEVLESAFGGWHKAPFPT
ncbi:MAG: amidase [Bdellovibrio sp.]|jgi:fatty acid amide hydrolase 2